MHFVTTSKNVGQNQKPFVERFFLVVFENGVKNLLHGQTTEKIAFEVRIKNNFFKSALFKKLFGHFLPKNRCT